MRRSLSELMSEVVGETERERPAIVAPDVEAARLREARAAYAREHHFTPGDLVRIKDGLRVISQPQGPPTGTFVVLEVFPDAEVFRDVRAPDFYGMKFDVILGFYDEDGDWMSRPYDSRRLEPIADALEATLPGGDA